MILSTGPAAWTGSAPLVVAARWRCSPMPAWQLAVGSACREPGRPRRWSSPGACTWYAAAVMDIGGWGQTAARRTAGFCAGAVDDGVAGDRRAWHREPPRAAAGGAPSARSAVGAMAVALAWFPANVHLLASPWAPLHFVLGVASYGLFGAAVLHAAAAGREPNAGCACSAARRKPGALGMPLLQLGAVDLPLRRGRLRGAVGHAGAGRGDHGALAWDHKTVFSLLGWAVFAALLAGRSAAWLARPTSDPLAVCRCPAAAAGLCRLALRARGAESDRTPNALAP
jgi:hypothetical protein